MSTAPNSFWKDRRVLVTGAGGFTGRNLCDRLAREGAQVVAFLRRNGSTPKLEGDVELFTGDLTDSSDCERAAEGVDTIFHVAAQFRAVNVTDDDLKRVHVDATEYLLRAAKKAGCRRFVHTSTIGVHGSVKNGPGDENTEFAPGDTYQSTKLEGELLALEIAPKLGVDITVVRPCAIYGPGDRRFVKLVKPISKGGFVMIGSGEARYHFVHINDLVDGYLLAAERESGIGETFLIGGEERPTLNELAAEIADILHVSPPKIKVPLAPVYAAGWLCEKASALLNVEPILHRRRIKFFTNNRDFSIGKATKLLGYQPQVDLRTGLSELIESYRREGLI